MARMRKQLEQSMCAVAVLVAVAGCNSKQDTSHVGRQIDQLMESTERSLESLGAEHEGVSEAASAELKKVFNFEYKALRLPEGASLEGLESSLNQAGQDRWDCFQVILHDSHLVALCKRPPKTPLRYIPRILP